MPGAQYTPNFPMIANPFAPRTTGQPNNPRMGLAAMPGMGGGGTTNYFLNGMPIQANQLDAALKALQTPTADTAGQPFDPAAPFNQPVTPGKLPGLDTSGVNPYLQDPLMSSAYGLQNPFYGDPELFNAPTSSGILG